MVETAAIEATQVVQKVADRLVPIDLVEEGTTFFSDVVPDVAQVTGQAEVEKLDRLPETGRFEMMGGEHRGPLILVPGGLEHVTPDLVEQAVHLPGGSATVSFRQQLRRRRSKGREAEKERLSAIGAHEAHEATIAQRTLDKPRNGGLVRIWSARGREPDRIEVPALLRISPQPDHPRGPIPDIRRLGTGLPPKRITQPASQSTPRIAWSQPPK